MLRPQVSSVVQLPQSAAASTAVVSHQSVPHKQELFTEAEVSKPSGVALALRRVQQNASDATAPARSLPFQGGNYFPQVKLTANTPAVIAHRVQGGGPVACLPMAPSAAAVVWVVGQNTEAGTITVESPTSCLIDLYFFARPVAR